MPIDVKALRTGEEKGMNMAREKSMKTFEELYAEPPPYSSQPPSAQASTSSAHAGGSVPATGEMNFQPSPLEIPTPAECIAHLKLLHAFAKLRHDIGNTDGLYGISMEDMDEKQSSNTFDGNPATNDGAQQPGGEYEHDATQTATDSSTPERTAALAERIRDKRWSIFVAKAVDRYEKWWDKHNNVSNVWYSRIRKSDFEASVHGYSNDKARSMLPLTRLGRLAHGLTTSP